MKKASSKNLTPAAKAELKRLHALPYDKIDTDDIPEVRDWSDARRGVIDTVAAAPSKRPIP